MAGLVYAEIAGVAKQAATVLPVVQHIWPDFNFITSADYNWSKSKMMGRGLLDTIESRGDQYHQSIHHAFQDFKINWNNVGQWNLVDVPRTDQHTTIEQVQFILEKITV